MPDTLSNLLGFKCHWP